MVLAILCVIEWVAPQDTLLKHMNQLEIQFMVWHFLPNILLLLVLLQQLHLALLDLVCVTY